MASFLTSSEFGKIELNEQKRIRTMIQEKWEKAGFVDGLKGHIKENVATLFENQARSLMTEATDAQNSGSFETVVFPIVRRVFSKLLANDIVSVQAMNLPIGKLFFILPVTSERKWDVADQTTISNGDTGSHYGLQGYERTDRRNGNQYNRFYLPDEVVDAMAFEKFNGTAWVALTATNYDAAVVEAAGAPVRQSDPAVTQYMRKTLYDLFYNDFLYDNSKGKIHIKVADNAKAVILNNSGEWIETSLASYPKSGLDGTVRNVILRVKGFSSYNASKMTGPDGNEMDTEAFLASMKVINNQEIASDSANTFSCFAAGESIPFRVVTQKYGKGIVEYNAPCSADGEMFIELDLSKPVRNQGATMDGYVGVDPTKLTSATTFKIAWAQYDSLELETEMGEVSFKLDSVTVSVEERKLRASWSTELAQDVSAFHNIDAEAELTAILSEQIGAELDREILRDLRKVAPWQARWDVNGWRRMAAFSTNYTQKDWNQELMTKINQISAQIHKATLRGGANWIVVSSEISALLDNLEYFHVTDASAESDQYNMGIERIGSLSGRYQVYRDPYAPSWSLIMGHKGKSLLDTGYIYAPYIPMQLTPTMYNPFNFAPVKGIMTRYAKKVVNNRYFGAIRVDGLTTFDTKEFR